MLLPQWSLAMKDLLLHDSNGRSRPIFTHIVQPYEDDDGLFVCPLCPCGFRDISTYTQHVNQHYTSRLYIILYYLTAHWVKRHVHTGQHKVPPDALGAAYSDPENLEDIKKTVLRTACDITPGLGNDFHAWHLVITFARFSVPVGDKPKMIDVTLKSSEMIQQSLKATYISTFNSTSQRWGRNSASAAQRPSRLPVYGNRRKIWGNSRARNGDKRGFYVPKFEMDEARTLIPFPQTPAKLPNRSRMLFLSQSLEGFTTNLPSLVAMSGDFSDHDVWLGFRFAGNRSQVNIGQFTKAGQQWAFYSLHRLRQSLVGEINDDTYSAVTRLWFLIQKAKQGCRRRHSQSQWSATGAQ